MYLGASPFDAAAEAAAFRRLHTLTVAITQARASGADWRSLVPYYRQALADYRAAGASDPDYLTTAEQFLSSLGDVGSGTVRALDTISQRLLAAGVITAGILYLWRRR